jgi:L-asparaginase II
MQLSFAFPADEADPVLVEVTRGDMVESVHRGAVAIVDAQGGVVARIGDIDRPVFARSAIKPLQALPLVESGAADRYRLADEELALACASHRGEPAHTERVAAWLGRIGLAPGDLECGAHPPYNPETAEALVCAGEKPTALHNNCSGKHSGFLSTARHLGEPTRGYIGAEHPVQRRIARTLEEMTGLDLSRAPRGIDGCGIPVVGFPLAAMARAMARLVDPKGLPAGRGAAGRRLVDAMAAEPVMVDGSDGSTAAIMRAAGDQVRLKPGAEGVLCAVLPTLGYGVAIKIDDGSARARDVVLGAILDRFGVLSDAQRTALDPYFRPVIRNVAEREVGSIRPAAALLQ